MPARKSFNNNTVNRESFTGLTFRGILEKYESFSYESFALSMDIYRVYKHTRLVPRKYQRENPYTVDTANV